MKAFIFATTLLLTCVFILDISHASTIQSLENSLNAKPDQLAKRQALGEAYERRKNYKKVIEILSPYSNEIDEESYIRLAEAYGKTGDNLNEIRLFQAMVEKFPNRFRPHFLLGMAYKRDKKLSEAAKELRASKELAPKHRPSYDALLEIFFEDKNNYEARELLQEMVQIFGKKSEFTNHLCRVYSSEGYLEQSAKACQEAMQKNPKFPDNHVYLGQAYYDKGNKQAAEKVFKNAAHQFPRSEFVQYAAGQFYFQEKNYSAAARYLENAVRLKSDSQRSQLVLGMALFEIKKYEQSLIHFDKACRMDKTKESSNEFRSASFKLFKMNENKWGEKFDKAIALCGGI